MCRPTVRMTDTMEMETGTQMESEAAGMADKAPMVSQRHLVYREHKEKRRNGRFRGTRNAVREFCVTRGGSKKEALRDNSRHWNTVPRHRHFKARQRPRRHHHLPCHSLSFVLPPTHLATTNYTDTYRHTQFTRALCTWIEEYDPQKYKHTQSQFQGAHPVTLERLRSGSRILIKRGDLRESLQNKMMISGLTLLRK